MKTKKKKTQAANVAILAVNGGPISHCKYTHPNTQKPIESNDPELYLHTGWHKTPPFLPPPKNYKQSHELFQHKSQKLRECRSLMKYPNDQQCQPE